MPTVPVRPPWPPSLEQIERLFTPARLQRGVELQSRLLEVRSDALGASARVGGTRGVVFELSLQGVADRQGQPHYSALCTCSTQRFCEHAAAVLLSIARSSASLNDWAAALKRQAGKSELRALPKLAPADAARLLDLMQGEEAPAAEAARFRPQLTLQTLGRGDGLLGMARHGVMGPRGANVTVARVDWTYQGPGEDGDWHWQLPAPQSILNSRPAATARAVGRVFARDLATEAEARDQLWSLGLQPLDPAALQWRDQAAALDEPLWTLPQESDFGAFRLERVPELEAAGWAVDIRPGFAHEPVLVEGWSAKIERMAGPRGLGSWLLSLGLEIDGESLDLAPMIADLLRRDARWHRADLVDAIDDDAIISLHAPGGRRIAARAAPLKAVVGAMIDLLAERGEGPIPLSDWDADRLSGFESGPWLLQGDADLRRMAERLRTAGTPPAVAAPVGLTLQLRSYQLAGLAWLQYLRAQGLAGILADDMGLGKTAQALAHVLLEKEQGRLQHPALVVLPSSLLFNWAAEARRITPGLRVLVLHGPARDLGGIADADLVLTSYPLVWRDSDALAKKNFHLLILDEAQMVKNAGSRAARALRKLRATHRLCLTGTPLENHLGELWAQFDFLMPGFLGDARSFARLWRKPIETNGETLRAQLLAQRVRPFILRRSKDQVATELPPLSTLIRRVRLEGRQRELYESVRVAADTQVRRALARGGFERNQISVLDALLKLRQACCDPRLVRTADEALDSSDEPMEYSQAETPVSSAKLEWIRDNLPELLDEGRRVLVFSQFTSFLDLVAAELDALGLSSLQLTGATPVAQRGDIVRRFQAGELPLLLISLKAGGVGLNLTAADTVIHLDPWWNPAVEAQASARAHRIGQERPVFVYKVVVEGSIEERMLELQERKKALADAVLGRDGAETVKFSAEDLDLLLAPLTP